MKKLTSFFIIIIVIIIAILIAPQFTAKKISLKSFPKSYGMMNPQKRVERDIRMLADPTTGKIPEGIRVKELAFAQTLPQQNSANRGSGYEWKAQGPFNVGGRTRAAAFDINNESILIAGGNSGAIYRSTDGGQSWSKAQTPYMAIGASCIAQDTRTNKTNIWYIGTGERFSSAGGGGSAYWLGNGILKSIDNGITWDTLSSTTSNSPQSFNTFDKIWNIATDPSSSEDELYVATNLAIYKSTDGGNSFTATLSSSGASGYSYSDVICTPSGVIYATLGSDGDSKGIWRSDDGDTWTAITPASEIGSNYNRIVSCYTPQNENSIYFLANTPGVGKENINFVGNSEWNSLLKYEYNSGDGSGTGGTWTNLSDNLPVGPHLFDDFNVQGSYDMLIRVKPNDSNVVIIGGTNLYRSTDGFISSNNITQFGGYKEDTELPLFEMYPNHHPDQHTAFFSNTNPNVMYSGSDGGLAKTSDIMANSVSWESLNKGYITTQFYTIAIDHATEGSSTIIGGLQDNGTQFTNSVDETADWNMSFSYDGAYCAIPDGAEDYYMSIQSGRIVKLKLDNNGDLTSYRRIDPIVPNANVYDFINPFILDPFDNNIMYLSVGNKLWRNNDLNNIDLNNEWDSITQGWSTYSGIASSSISSFGVTYSGSHRLYIGTDNGKVYKLDSANTKDNMLDSISSLGGYVSSISVDPRDDDKVLVTVSNYNKRSLYYTNDGGIQWWRVSGNLEGHPTHDLAPETYTSGPYPSCRWGEIIATEDGGTLYLVGTSVGLFATNKLQLGIDYETDVTNWTLQSPELIGNSIITMMDYRSSDGFIAIATHGAGVFTANIKNAWQLNDIKETKEVSFNVYPNPASNYITIDFENNEPHQLEFYDIKGSKVKSFQSTNKKINIEDLKNGSYIIKASQNAKVIGEQKFIKN